MSNDTYTHIIENRDDQAPKIRCGLLTSLLISFVRRLTMRYTGLKKWGKVIVRLCKEKSIDFNLKGNSARNVVILLHFFPISEHCVMPLY